MTRPAAERRALLACAAIVAAAQSESGNNGCQIVIRATMPTMTSGSGNRFE